VSILLSVNFLGACTHEQPAASAPAPGAEDEQRIVDRSAEAVRRLRGNPEFAALDGFLKDARGVLVFPSLVKASFILGGEGGNGVLVARGADGTFSAPAFYSIGAGSVGLQVGYREAAVVLLLMKETALSAVLRSGLTLGADATVAAGNNTGEARSATATKDVIAFVDAGGVYAGASVEGSVVEARPKGEHPVYSRRMLYIDLQTWVTSYAFTYDHAGNHKRTFLMAYLHPQFNPWKQEVWIPQIATQASIDYQRERASIFETRKVLYNQPLNPYRFTLAGLMLQGK